MKKYLTILALVAFFDVPAIAGTALGEGKTIELQAPQDTWQVRRAETHSLIQVLADENASQAQRDTAKRDFDARLTACERGKLTPMETMDLLQVFYVPQELQSKSPSLDLILEKVAMQATLGWYDALRFADDSGRSEILDNEAFFTRAFGDDTREVARFMKDQPERSAAAVKAGIQDARNHIEAGTLGYDAHWPASYGMLRVQCAMQRSKTCTLPAPQPAGVWPALLEQAGQRVSAFYRIDKDK